MTHGNYSHFSPPSSRFHYLFSCYPITPGFYREVGSTIGPLNTVLVFGDMFVGSLIGCMTGGVQGAASLVLFLGSKMRIG